MNRFDEGICRNCPFLLGKTMVMWYDKDSKNAVEKGITSARFDLTNSTFEVLNMAKSSLPQTCPQCNSIFTSQTKRRFCSKSCATKSYDHSYKFKHGQSSVKDKRPASPEYAAYQGAKHRCTNPNDPSYVRYGGRGIEFRFTSFQEFLEELGVKPSSIHSVNRIDNDGHYEAGNVEWATPTQQQQNTRLNRRLTFNGKTLVIGQWARVLGLTKNAINERLKKGWCVPCALSRTKAEGQWGCPHQLNNRNAWITWRGETMPTRAWEKRLGLNRSTIYGRLRLGWTVEEVFNGQRIS